MSLSKQRTSFALDSETIQLLQRLSGQWNVSQAEVVRRAVRIAAQEERADTGRLRHRLTKYQNEGRINLEEAERYLGEVAAERAGWERGGSA